MIKGTKKELNRIKTNKNLNHERMNQISEEEMKKRNSRAGKASAKSRAAKANLAKAVELVLSLPVVGDVKDMLIAMGAENDELTNATAVVANLFAQSMSGNIKATEMLMDYMLKVSEDQRKSKESEARIKAIEKSEGDVTVSSGEGEGDVMIYLPKIDEVQDEEPKEDGEE